MEAKRRITLITWASVLLLLGLFALAYYRYASGALAPSKWLTFIEPATLYATWAPRS